MSLGPNAGTEVCRRRSKVEVDNAPPLEKKLKTLPDMVKSLQSTIQSGDVDGQLDGTIQFCKLLSIVRNPPIKEVIESGAVCHFVEFLSKHDYPKLQFVAAWALTNIAFGTSDNTDVVIRLDAIPTFVELLRTKSHYVREQAVWALGNIASDSAKCRNLVLEHGALEPLLHQLIGQPNLFVLRNATWTLSNLCRGKPQPLFEKVKPALSTLACLINSEDEEVLTNVCWALSCLSDGGKDTIQAVIDSGVCPKLVDLLIHPSLSVLIPALRTVGNIVTGNELQTKTIIDLPALTHLLNLLKKNRKKSLQKEVCWTISNITAGNSDQIQAVIDANIISPLIHLLQNAEFEIKKEAAWAVSNATSGGTNNQIKVLVGEGCIKPLCDLLICPDPRIKDISLNALKKILKVGETVKSLGNTGDVNVHKQMIIQYLGHADLSSI